ncbi:Superfamily I DNA and/or RNA helicase [Pedobacter terrae]|uniref:Superfamily I DNA and/or RNA helicase n=1 Tax=Pedobacter terrae TaxID=405671 RepID=A0A1G8AAZ2_9SPHI|nr:ATP-binding protein [Pedobacter terrae]SDH18205.1 Superfamily I DNA and/or RNA helicase [Pedobacter terrae]
MNTQKNILKYWRDIEIFNLPDLPDDVGYLQAQKPLPWTEKLEPLEEAKRRYILYFGKQSKPDLVSIIEKLTDDTGEKPDWTAKVSGNSCMAVLILEENGQLIEDGGYLQASYLHGLTCLKKNTPMDTVPEKLQRVQEDFKERYKYDPFSHEQNQQLTDKPLSWEELKNEIKVLNDNAIEEISCGNTIFCKTIIISKKIKNSDTAFLNSFYLDDLNSLIEHPKHWNTALQSYLKPKVRAADRIDLLQSDTAFFQTLSPENMPIGKWPSDPAYGAYSAQLGAMNTALKELKTEGLIGINGPPGTGKTTLLNDIIAEAIVQRAKKLAESNNVNIFMPSQTVSRPAGTIMYYPIKQNIFEDTGIVVASNNNAAVENITKELPDKSKIHHSFKEADYFAEYSQELISKESWGLLSAALGNSENRNAFKTNFWYGKENKPGFDAYLKSLYVNAENEDLTIEYRAKFDTAKQELQSMIETFERFRNEAKIFHSQLVQNIKNLVKRHNLNIQINLLKTQKEKLSQELKHEDGNHKELNTKRAQVQENIKIQTASKPSFFIIQKWFSTRAYKNWNAPYQRYIDELNQINRQISGSEKKQEQLKQKHSENLQESSKLNTTLQPIIAAINNYNKQKQQLHEQYGIAYANIPDENLYSAYTKDRDTFHKANPWSSEQLNTLRGNIFLKSLELHQYAILANARQFRSNIFMLFEIMDSKVEVSNKIAETAWKTLFFLIPVVSTSLASVSRLFRNLSPSTIGYLLLDEAGQATPQSATGIINRSKRNIIIGDPLQIEPVLTTPHKLIHILNQPYQNEQTWSPLDTSAQKLADRITDNGTLMQQNNGAPIWTGFPLRTHRRCEDPMFTLANTIAYSGQMVKATEQKESLNHIGPSQWFDVQGITLEDRHVVIEEITLLKEKLEALGKEQEVFVISPFKSVANRCRLELSRSFPNAKCGTIHTFQGKETDIVFLILGSDPKRPGARAWASQKPNMLNVALTRAKRRFYIIGNRSLWQSCNYFDEVSKTLS